MLKGRSSVTATQRVFTVEASYRVLEAAFASLPDFISAHRRGQVSKAFQERLMLAVTHVNNCRYCRYFHTLVSLKAGLTQEEIQHLLAGEFSNAPPEEAAALMFAQHYAETLGNYDRDAYQQIITVYGEQTAREILAAVRMIMSGNVYGIMFDALQYRLRGRPYDGSTLGDEIGSVFGVFAFAPVIAAKQVWARITGAKMVSTPSA